MMLDYRSADVPSDIGGDLCIIGAGPAGIALALELAASGRDVTLLEGGGETPSAENQQLYAGDVIGRPYYPLDVTRLRVLGGSTGHWEGWCGSMSEIDFHQRDWVPMSGWPFGKADLDEYYVKAQEWLGLGPNEYEIEHWQDQYSDFPGFDRDKLRPRVWQFSAPPIRFAEAFGPELAASDRIRVFTHANVTRLALSENYRRIDSLDVRDLNGKSGSVRADTYVLACGGIENPRLLLASNDVARNGVGNDRDLVGRFFMEHPLFNCAQIHDFNLRQMNELHRLGSRSGIPLRVALTPSDAAQAQYRIANSAGFFWRVNYDEPVTAWDSVGVLGRALKGGRLPPQAGEKVGHAFRDFDSFAALLALKLRGIDRESRTIRDGTAPVNVIAEQVPNPDSRVLLSDRQDAFGKPLAALDWRLTDFDRHSIRQAMLLIGTEVNRLELGRFQLNETLRDENASDWPERVDGAHHHMGTTRMARDPVNGVVDGDCKVHGLANLYVAGSSVFPTGSYVNPTVTLLALTFRLARHLETLG